VFGDVALSCDWPSVVYVFAAAPRLRPTGRIWLRAL
jgi:hypothetical protein